MRALVFPLVFRLVLPAVLVGAADLTAQDHHHPEGDVATLGTVDFPISCAPDVRADFEIAVAMLHSFWLDAADEAFEALIRRAPDCAMVYWGRAVTLMGNPMTRVSPSSAALEEGRRLAARARDLAASASHREQMYADAVWAFYQDHESAGHGERALAHEAAMEALSRMHPEDPEAAIFHARSLVANAPPDDPSFRKLLEGARIMEPLFEAQPDHPGLAHYLIHAYDVPPLAERGVDAAVAYAGIAPSAPHALHMPSHIFTRLGLWDESIETNARSAQAEPNPDAAVHPMDYMVYAYLQQGRDAAAGGVVSRAVQNPDRFYSGLVGYNFTAMPARMALERARWAEAAQLDLPVGALPYVEAITRFARGVGAARSGKPDQARAEVAALEALRDVLEADGEAYWATVVESQRLATLAWVAHADGDHPMAVELARRAADLEETVEKHPVTPGPLLPARELEGDLLFALDRPAEAQRAYERTLEREPRRARSLFGAARSAERVADAESAEARYRELLQLMDRADEDRREVAEARRFLERR